MGSTRRDDGVMSICVKCGRPYTQQSFAQARSGLCNLCQQEATAAEREADERGVS